MKILKISTILLSAIFISKVVASNWVIINVGDVNTIIPNPKVEALSASTVQSGDTLTVNVGDSTNTQGYYYRAFEYINGNEIVHGWQCQTGTEVAANGNSIVEQNAFSGSYRYEVAACMTGSGCDVEAYESGSLICSEPQGTQTVSFVGNKSTGVVSAPEVNTSENEHVGTVSGSFRVSESGAATYNIPISVPKGIAGVTPQLSISYSSQGGDGYLGRGWSISGPTAISRCPKTIAQDGVLGGVTGTNSDRLCYNGQRLRPTSQVTSSGDDTYWQATQYVTEIDSFAIFHRLGNDVFVMETKSGEQHLFGDINSISSSAVDSMNVKFRPKAFKDHNNQDIPVAGGRPNNSTWLLRAIKDVKQNYILYKYVSNDNETYLDTVSHTGNLALDTAPFAVTKFSYLDNPKPAVGYFNQQAFKVSKLLNNIHVQILNADREGQTPAIFESYRYYDLNYFTSEFAEEKNYLESIDECIDTSKSNCKSSLTFDWQKPAPITTTNSLQCETESGARSQCFPTSEDDPFKPFSRQVTEYNGFDSAAQIFDMNSDGYADLVYVKSGSWKIRKGPEYAGEQNLVTGNTEYPEYAATLDYDGDGNRDLLIHTDTNVKIITYKSSPTTTEQCQRGGSECWEVTKESRVVNTAIPSPTNKSNLHIVDLNGDTLEDIIIVDSKLITFYESTGEGFKEGRQVFSVTGSEEIAAISKDSSIKNANLLNTAATDFNGDGLTDIAIQVDKYDYHCYGVTVGSDGPMDLMNNSSPSENFAPDGSDTNSNYRDLYAARPTITKTRIFDIETEARCREVSDNRGYDYPSWEKKFVSRSWDIHTAIAGTAVPKFRQAKDFTIGNVNNPRFADLNADGYIDILYQSGDEWVYRISNGKSFLTQYSTGYSVSQDLSRLFYVIDLNGDGRTDLLHPGGSGSYWDLVLSMPNLNKPDKVEFISRGRYQTEHKDTQVRFGELNGDGRVDLLMESDGKWAVHLANPKGRAQHVINRITNGFGVTTKISYSSLMDESVYTSDYSPLLDSNSPYYQGNKVISPKGGMFVVSKVSSETSNNQYSSVSYNYGGLVIDKLGRGNLGFYSLTTTDRDTCDILTTEPEPFDSRGYPQTTQIDYSGCISTTTNYYQSFPYTGMPQRTIRLKETDSYTDDLIISESTNEVGKITTVNNATFPYLSSSVDHSYSLNDTARINYYLSKTVSSFLYDIYGNLYSSTVTVSEGGDKSTSNYLKTETKSTFGADTTSSTQESTQESIEIGKKKGRLIHSEVTKSLFKSNALHSTNTKEVSFSYYPSTSLFPLMLQSETTEPNKEKYQTSKSYEYDSWGNIHKVTISSKDLLTPNETITNYDASGRFLLLKQQRSNNEYSYVTSYSFNGTSEINKPVLGLINTSRVISPSGVVTSQTMDLWGRPYLSEAKDRNNKSLFGQKEKLSLTSYCTVNVTCPTGAAYYTYQYTPGFTDGYAYFDAWGREVRTATKLMDGKYSVTEKQYNTKGQLQRVSEPFKAISPIGGAGVYWSTSYYDKLRRVDRTVQANSGSTDISYQGYMTLTTNALGQTQKSSKNYLGQTSTVEDSLGTTLNYSYYVGGELEKVKVDDNVRVTNTYDLYGRKLSTDDQDKGYWRYVYDSLGRIEMQTNAKGTSVSFQYDDQGRKVRREEPEGTTCWYYGQDVNSNSFGQLRQIKQFGSSVSCNSSTTPIYTESYTHSTSGKVQTKTVEFDGEQFTTVMFYDGYTRLRNVSYTNSGVDVRYEYKNGIQYKVINNTSNSPDYGKDLKEVLAVNARGQASQVKYANGVYENRDYWAETGLADKLEVIGDGWNNTQTYVFDEVGNLFSRNIDALAGNKDYEFSEVFYYDDLNRLETRSIASTGTDFADFEVAEGYSYDKYGNILTKTGLSTYVYDSQNPYRLNSIGGEYNFKYDLNGNVENDGSRIFKYTSFDKPYEISKDNGATKTEFIYGPGRQVLRKRDTRDSKLNETLYLDGYERVKLSNGIVENKYYVGNIVITKRNIGTNETYFLHKDHLGSTIAVSDMGNKNVQQFLYDPFGNQSTLFSNTDLSNPFVYSAGIDRGYTGHKMIDDLDIIHMNGRIYDPTLGRFLQADPHIQAPKNSQNYNRYSYVLNNPMSYTDPSGYFFKKLFGGLAKSVFRAIGQNKFLSSVISIGLYFVPGCQTGVCSMAFNAAVTYAVTGSLKAAAIGFAAGAISPGGFDPTAFLIRGAIGGLANRALGGNFGHGFIAAGASGAAGGVQNPWGRILASAVIGGTVSKITGGKFANGATSAAFATAVQAGFNGEFSSNNAVGSSSKNEMTKKEIEQNTKELRKKIDALSADGTIDSNRMFSSEDMAASEILKEMSPLSKEYGLEIGGSITYDGKFYRYSDPVIGSNISVTLDPNWTGYHTHPVGGLNFSNSITAQGNATDVKWVNTHSSSNRYNNGLYLGVFKNNKVSIGFCEPYSCSNIAPIGPTGRIVSR